MANLTGRVSKSAVDRMAAGSILRDSELRGFGARRQIGAPIYFLQKRINGRLRWITIGTHGAPWTAETARREALRLLGQIAGGSDPAPQREQPPADTTLVTVAPLFMEEHGPKLKPLTQEKYQSVLSKHILPVLGELRVGDIKRRDVTRLHGQLVRYPTIANYAVAVLSKCLTWCEDHGLRPERSNPCGRLKKYAERKRHRYLTAGEYARLGATIAKAERLGTEDPFVLAALRLLILTGARLNEILTLKWSYVDLDSAIRCPPLSSPLRIFGCRDIAVAFQPVPQIAEPVKHSCPFAPSGLDEARPGSFHAEPLQGAGRQTDKVGRLDGRQVTLRIIHISRHVRSPRL